MKRILLVTIAALLLGACASGGTRDGMVYRDGSWYAPASEGHGDYYTGTAPGHAIAYDWPWAWSVGFVPYGGYCPAMYRYCTSFWADPFYGAGHYSGYYPYWYAYQPWPARRQRAPAGQDEPPLARRDRRERGGADPAERRSPRTREEGSGSQEDGGAPRPRRRGNGPRTSPN